jgi:hypothetical protein
MVLRNEAFHVCGSEQYLSPIDRLEAWQLANTSFLHAISVPEPSQISMHRLILSRLPSYGRVADNSTRRIGKRRLFYQDLSALMRPSDNRFTFTRHAKDIAMRILI